MAEVEIEEVCSGAGCLNGRGTGAQPPKHEEGLPRGDRDERNTMFSVWEDRTVVLPNFGNGPTRRLLNGLTGCAEPSRIMDIMGPSGSGKSTLSMH